jgi:hypothetical protein
MGLTVLETALFLRSYIPFRPILIRNVITELSIPTFLWTGWLLVGGECKEVHWRGNRNSLAMWRGLIHGTSFHGFSIVSE